MSVVQVQIIVAVDTNGNVECIPFAPYNVQKKQKSDEFLAAKRADARRWQISYLTATVPVPTEPMIEAEVKPQGW